MQLETDSAKIPMINSYYFRGDIESLKISDIDFESNCIATKNKKTRKSMGSRPVSAELMTELLRYVCGLDVGQEKLFGDSFNHYKWRKVCKKSWDN